MPVPHILVISRLAKEFRAGAPHCEASISVLRGVSLRVRAGDFITVEGVRGAGKTTLLRCAAGLLRPSDGSVEWPALPVAAGRPPAGVALVPDRSPQHAFLTVRESIGYVATVREAYAIAAAPDTNSILDLAALRYVEDLRVGLLAAAERARLVVALGLVAAPSLLLVDDVEGGTDAVGRAAFARFLGRVASTGVGVVWAGRSVGAVAGATGAYLLDRGQIRRNAPGRTRPRLTLELDVPAAAKAAALLALSVPVVECRGPRLRVPLDRTSAEDVLDKCRTLFIPVHAYRVVREP